jgi:hypothetical protein
MLFLLLTALVTTGCSKTTEAYLPSNDPLVLVRFERLLTRNGISFNKGPDGMYTPDDPKAFERMVSLGHDALNIGARSGLVVKPGCALSKLKGHLDGLDIAYAMTQVDGEPNLMTTNSDFHKYKVMENYASFEADCAQGI